MTKIFISYAHVDQPRVRELVDILRAGGHDPWFDHRLVVGQPWQDQLLAAISTCDCFLYAMTPEAIASTWCQWEFAQAVHLGKPIVPVLVQANTTPGPVLDKLQYADFSDGPTPEGVARLMGGVAVAQPIDPALVSIPVTPGEQPERPTEGDNRAPAGIPLSEQFFQDGYAAFQDKEFETAFDLLTACVEMQPDHAGALALLRQIERRKGWTPAFRRPTQVAGAARGQAGLSIADLKERLIAYANASGWNANMEGTTDEKQAALRALLVKALHEESILLARRERQQLFDQIAADLLGGEADPQDAPAAPAVIRQRGDLDIPVPELVTIPAGPFLMGSDPARDKAAEKNEQPQITLDLPEYQIGKYPVTVEEYRAFIDAGGYNEAQYWTEAGWRWRRQKQLTQPNYWDDDQWTGNPRYPVVGVSWYEAWAYTRWLSEQVHGAAGWSPLSESRMFRLPTEPEWEKAARGTDGRIYPWGDVFDPGHCNTRTSKIEQTTRVGLYENKSESPYGCADMAGNVWEWCLTRLIGNTFWDYGAGEAVMSNQPDGDNIRVARGGSWFSYQQFARAAARNQSAPTGRYRDYGFRVCRR
jgi:formylglycine-generating enzyme required for sulfatase activity